ncbi:MAG TPA: hypothetical protein VGN20_14750 [Mucilaginibacter sp.]|jgi:hypothetical protein
MENTKQHRGGKLFTCLFTLSFILMGLFAINPVSARPATVKMATIEIPLSAFEGIYQNKVNTFAYFKVTAVNNTLVAKQIEGNQQFVLTRKSELAFEMKDGDGDETIPVAFFKNDAGEIAQVVVAGNDTWNKVKEYVPVKEVKLSADQLKAFAGKYEFKEKPGTFLQITPTPTGLTLKQLWDDREINFIAISDVGFLNKEMAFPLKFTKDKDGNAIKVLAFNRDSWDKVKE